MIFTTAFIFASIEPTALPEIPKKSAAQLFEELRDAELWWGTSLKIAQNVTELIEDTDVARFLNTSVEAHSMLKDMRENFETVHKLITSVKESDSASEKIMKTLRKCSRKKWDYVTVLQRTIQEMSRLHRSLIPQLKMVINAFTTTSERFSEAIQQYNNEIDTCPLAKKIFGGREW